MTEDGAGHRDLARLLLEYEAWDESDPLLMADALHRVCRKLHHQLARVVGELGIRLMMHRALTITRDQFSFLADTADPNPGDGECLKGLGEALRGQEPAVSREAVTSILTNLLELLQGMLGEKLTSVLLRETWPEVDIPQSQ